jgi:hypothetical protein
MLHFKETAITDYVLNIVDRNEEDLEFIKVNLENDLILKEKNNGILTVVRYENHRSYDFPSFLFKESESEQEESEIIDNFAIKDFKIKKAHIVAGLVILSISLILIKSTDFSSANLLTTGPIKEQLKTNTSFYQLQTEKKNSNNLLKASELQEQERLRGLLNDSVSKVISYDKENKIIDEQLISASNKK